MVDEVLDAVLVTDAAEFVARRGWVHRRLVLGALSAIVVVGLLVSMIFTTSLQSQIVGDNSGDYPPIWERSVSYTHLPLPTKAKV